ncbi:hypothetical protein [Lentzea albidocapillata]|uniref:Lipoprotein n=1 Tax=Lentzea albidocapillata TaxID=40571 RepID=A0A1W2D142_9PSEU|nr:hypothetical protein [Lentzea albidocapillata]SMC90782.1 hypothetical protein SAMN05660733_02590 [Lentzea albidocapillata]
MNPRLSIGAAVLLLSACSQAAPPSSNVASLQSTGAVASSSAAAPPADGEQPRLRMDMTEEEKQRLYDAHTACLAEKDPNATGTGAGPAGRGQYSDEARKLCAKKWPLPPWEMDSGNPAFADNWHKNVQCLNSRGMKVIETEPGSWTYDGEQTLPDEQRHQIEKECEQEVFGGGRK